MNKEPCCGIDDFIKAMGDETRQKILVILHKREMNVSEINEHLDVTQPTVSHHLAILSRACLVTARRAEKYVYYQVNQACVAECCSGILDRFNIIETDWKGHENS